MSPASIHVLKAVGWTICWTGCGLIVSQAAVPVCGEDCSGTKMLVSVAAVVIGLVFYPAQLLMHRVLAYKPSGWHCIWLIAIVASASYFWIHSQWSDRAETETYARSSMSR